MIEKSMLLSRLLIIICVRVRNRNRNRICILRGLLGLLGFAGLALTIQTNE